MSGAIQAFTSLTVRFTKKRHLFRFLWQIFLAPGLAASERAPKMQHLTTLAQVLQWKKTQRTDLGE